MTALHQSLCCSRPRSEAESAVRSTLALAVPVTKPLANSPLYLLTPSAQTDFPPSSKPYNAIVIGLSPPSFCYEKLNEAFRLLAGEEEGVRKGEMQLVVTHRAKYFGDTDGKLSLGPGEPHFCALREQG